MSCDVPGPVPELALPTPPEPPQAAPMATKVPIAAARANREMFFDLGRFASAMTRVAGIASRKTVPDSPNARGTFLRFPASTLPLRLAGAMVETTTWKGAVELAARGILDGTLQDAPAGGTP